MMLDDVGWWFQANSDQLTLICNLVRSMLCLGGSQLFMDIGLVWFSRQKHIQDFTICLPSIWQVLASTVHFFLSLGRKSQLTMPKDQSPSEPRA